MLAAELTCALCEIRRADEAMDDRKALAQAVADVVFGIVGVDGEPASDAVLAGDELAFDSRAGRGGGIIAEDCREKVAL
jgi:hypothetical protein